MVTAHSTHLRVGMVNEVNLCLDDKFHMGVTSNPSEVLLRKPNLHIRLVEGESRIFAHFSALIALEFFWIALESCWILIAESEFRNLKKKTFFMYSWRLIVLWLIIVNLPSGSICQSHIRLIWIHFGCGLF